MVKSIVIYTTNTCAYCVMVKKWLNSKNIEYSEVNLDDHPERATEPYELTQQNAVPVTVITKDDDSQEVVVGFNLAKLAPAVA